MALIGNHSVLHKSFAFFTNGTTTAGAYAATARTNWTKPSILRARFTSLPPRTSIPVGYNLGEAYLGAWKSGGLSSGLRINGSATVTASGISARLSSASISGEASVIAGLSVVTPGASTLGGAGTIAAALLSVSNGASTLSGSASVSASLSALVPLATSLSGAATVSALANGLGSLASVIDIGASDPLSPSSLADAVWDTVLADHLDAGTTGAALNDAGSAGNPWSADLASNNTAGTFGAFVQKLLTVAKFLGLK